MSNNVREEVRKKANECKLSHKGKEMGGAEACVKGFYIYWCDTHNQPWAWCMIDIEEEMLEDERNKWKEVMKV